VVIKKFQILTENEEDLPKAISLLTEGVCVTVAGCAVCVRRARGVCTCVCVVCVVCV